MWLGFGAVQCSAILSTSCPGWMSSPAAMHFSIQEEGEQLKSGRSAICLLSSSGLQDATWYSLSILLARSLRHGLNAQRLVLSEKSGLV